MTQPRLDLEQAVPSIASVTIVNALTATFETLAAVLIAVAFGLSLAHALELPGKRRLGAKAYLAVQPIYYPGFTIGGGIGEAGGALATIVLWLLTPFASKTFWLVLIALLGLLAMQAVYWILTHPTNSVWLRAQKLQGFSKRFFDAHSGERKFENGEGGTDWVRLRNRWEWSHVIRAGCGLVSLVAIIVAAQSGH